MTALPPILISILQPCVEHRVTHVAVSDQEIVLYKGEKELGRAEGPLGGLAQFAELMRLLSMEIDDEHRHAEFQTPLGKLSATIKFDPHTILLMIDPNSPALLQARFNELVTYAARQGAQKVNFTPQGLVIWKDGEVIGTGEIEPEQLTGFIALAREIANMEEGENTGTAVLLGNESSPLLRIQIAEREGQFAVIVNIG